jgi:hypothetical protein
MFGVAAVVVSVTSRNRRSAGADRTGMERSVRMGDSECR